MRLRSSSVAGVVATPGVLRIVPVPEMGTVPRRDQARHQAATRSAPKKCHAHRIERQRAYHSWRALSLTRRRRVASCLVFPAVALMGGFLCVEGTRITAP